MIRPPSPAPGRNFSKWRSERGVLAVGRKAVGLILDPRLAVEVVGPRAGHAVDEEAAGPAELGGDAAARDVDLLDVELGEVLVGVAEEGVRHVDAVIEERVVLAAAAGVDAHVGRSMIDARVRDSRRELERPGERPRERQLLDRLLRS